MLKLTEIEKKKKKLAIKRALLIKKCRDSFWTFCKVLEPDFYQEHRVHLKEYCELLQKFIEDKLILPNGEICDSLMINEPPQHGKTRTIKNLFAWYIGKNIKAIIGNTSYNDTKAQEISKMTRDFIAMPKNNPNDIVYSDIFPEVKLKHGDKSVKRWAIEGRHLTMKSGTSVTGTGFSLICVDDPIKDSEVALNPNALEKIWNWITGTLLSRRGTSKVKMIVVMTRWAGDDPCGKFLQLEPDKWKVFSYPVEKKVKGESFMLCPDLLDHKALKRLADVMPEPIFKANYYNVIVDFKNRIFKPKYYTEFELSQIDFDLVFSVFDSAKGGGDYASMNIYGLRNDPIEPDNYYLYLLDWIYTQEIPDVYEAQMADLLKHWNTSYNRVEKNNGGHEIGKNIERILRLQHKVYLDFDYFHRGNDPDIEVIAKGQKEARILAYSGYMNNRTLFPIDFKDRDKEAYNEYTKYQKGKNKHDDFTENIAVAHEAIDKGFIDVNVSYSAILGKKKA